MHNHLQMILCNQRQVDRCPELKQVIHQLLLERGEAVPAFDPVAEQALADAAFEGMLTFWAGEAAAHQPPSSIN